eukprot:564498-Pelagomonas_calceolata.AAC.3
MTGYRNQHFLQRCVARWRQSSVLLGKARQPVDVGDNIDLEILRGSSIQHVDVTLEANQTPPSQNFVIIEPRMVPVPVWRCMWDSLTRTQHKLYRCLQQDCFQVEPLNFLGM